MIVCLSLATVADCASNYRNELRRRASVVTADYEQSLFVDLEFLATVN